MAQLNPNVIGCCGYSAGQLRVGRNDHSNKFAQSNLGRGPHHGTVSHVCRISPHWLQWYAPNSPPKVRYPFPWTDTQTPLPASSLDPSDLWCQTASGSDPPFFHNALDRLMHRTDWCTDRPTDAQTDRSFTGKFDHYRPLCYESDVA